MMEGSHGRVLQRCKGVNKTPEASPRSLSLGDTMQFTKYAETPSLKKKKTHSRVRTSTRFPTPMPGWGKAGR